MARVVVTGQVNCKAKEFDARMLEVLEALAGVPKDQVTAAVLVMLVKELMEAEEWEAVH